MVMARLHIICGNCGSNNNWELNINRLGDDVSDDSATMTCTNCSTIHDLKDNAKKIVATREGGNNGTT